MLERCTHVMREDGAVKLLTRGLRQSINAAVERMAKDALRCLVAAQKVTPTAASAWVNRVQTLRSEAVPSCCRFLSVHGSA